MSDSIGSVSVDVVPDATGFPEKLRAKLRDLEVRVGVNLDDARARAQLDKLASSRRSVTVKADADTKLAAAKLDKLGKNRTARIKAVVDRSGFRQAEAGSTGAARGMGLMATSALALTPALIPATAAVLGLAGALAAPALAGGGGFAIFAGVTTAALVKAKKDAKSIADLRKQAGAATDPKKARELNKQADQALAKLPKAERQFVKTQGVIGRGFDRLLKRSGDNVFSPLTHGSELIAKVLPKTAPIVNAFGRETDRVLTSLDHFADSKKFDGFVHFLSTDGVGAFRSFVGISGHVALGVGSIVKALSPLGGDLMTRLERSSRSLDNIGQSRGFQGFLRYVHQVGPQVAHTFGDIAGAGARVVQVLAPQGSVLLRFADHVALLIKNAPPGRLAAIAGGIGAVGLATGRLGKLTGLSLLVTSLAYANKHSGAFHTLAVGAGELVSVLGHLPGSVHALGALGGVLAARKLGAGRALGGGGGLASKVLGGGVQKVFVVNMPKGGFPGAGPGGGGGKPGGGKPPVVAAGKFSLGAFGTAALSTAGLIAIVKITDAIDKKFNHTRLSTQGLTADLKRYGDTGKAGGQLTKTFGDHLGDLSKRAHDFSGAAGGINRSMLWLEKLEPGTDDMNNANKAFKDTDKSLVKLSHTNPGSALKAFHRIIKATGLSAADAAKLFPKASKALRDVGRNMSLVRAQRLATDFTHGTSKAIILSGALRKLGISTGEYHKKLHSLPSQVATKVTTPGMVTSRKEAIRLGHQYGLTPRQIRTLIQLAGVNKAVTEAARARAALAAIPSVKHVTIQFARGGNPAAFKPPTEHQASGGLMNVGRSTLVGEFGPELVEPAGPSFVHTAAATRDLMRGQDSGSSAGAGGVFHIYDSDGVLLGTMKGTADARIKGHSAHAATAGRRRVTWR